MFINICINILHLLMSGVKKLETSKLVNKTKSNCLTIYHALTSLPVYNIYLKSSKYRKGPRWFSKMIGLLSLIYIIIKFSQENSLEHFSFMAFIHCFLFPTWQESLVLCPASFCCGTRMLTCMISINTIRFKPFLCECVKVKQWR